MAENPPAFPRAASPGANYANESQEGLSLLDYFAAKALEGYLASFAGEGDFPTDYDAVASIVYAIAAAMLKAREK